MKQENVQLSHLKADLESFKAKADRRVEFIYLYSSCLFVGLLELLNYELILHHRCKELEAEVAKRDADLTQMAELFKKETALRKKYKNDLEDLKGYVCKYMVYDV